ncbi:CYTH domain-containing protein [Chitinasiproducens palmae]|uniref:CYTH domain-containing protein n=1 Tax=Chitinasiproducens palmae TaxID=1770053 RepID=A0A1H2PTL2_9BURK|nr:CYTH domain-containing protein [Chitinasiproducens palmae]SDV50436.1 CYTH domain-containing protein [Chitinasiproducens palmae]
MAIEKEIKLALPGDPRDAVAFFERTSGQPGVAKTVSNAYFDTPDCLLAARRMALRLRQIGGAWRQTLKTSGDAHDGLHVRHEWELPVQGPALEIESLLAECDDAAARAALTEAAPRLERLFSTDFVRTAWLLEADDSRFEAVVDVGEIHAARTSGGEAHPQRAPICEIEVELLEGNDDALRAFAERVVAALPGASRADVSKAERGYLLVRGHR